MPAGHCPDILIIMADQLVPSALPFHGSAVTKAPAMSWLAESGVVFDAAYTASPLCSPARASFMTGLLPSHTGVFDNAAEFSSVIPTFAHWDRFNLKLLVRGLVWDGSGVLVLVGAAGRSC